MSGHPLHIVGRTSFTLGPVSEAPLSLISGGVAGEEAAVKGAPFFGAAERTLDGRLLSPIIGIEGKGGVTAGAANGKNGDSKGERNRQVSFPLACLLAPSDVREAFNGVCRLAPRVSGWPLSRSGRGTFAGMRFVLLAVCAL